MTEQQIIKLIEKNKPKSNKAGVYYWYLNEPDNPLDFGCSIGCGICRVPFDKREFNISQNQGKHKLLIKQKFKNALREIKELIEDIINEAIKRVEKEIENEN